MYQACRHIKPSGLRLKSPAMREHLFCYFHARVHTRVSDTDLRGLNFPVPEDFAPSRNPSPRFSMASSPTR